MPTKVGASVVVMEATVTSVSRSLPLKPGFLLSMIMMITPLYLVVMPMVAMMLPLRYQATASTLLCVSAPGKDDFSGPVIFPVPMWPWTARHA